MTNLKVTTRLNISLPRQWSHPVDNNLRVARRLHTYAKAANGKTAAGRKWLWPCRLHEEKQTLCQNVSTTYDRGKTGLAAPIPCEKPAIAAIGAA
jgi:hypothetical protein